MPARRAPLPPRIFFSGPRKVAWLAFKHVNAQRADGGKHVVQILRRSDIIRNQFIHLHFLWSEQLSSRPEPRDVS
jgi:hypothetical protein